MSSSIVIVAIVAAAFLVFVGILLRFLAKLFHATTATAPTRADPLSQAHTETPQNHRLREVDHMPKGFEINKRGIAKMMQEMQKEFDKHTIHVGVEAETPPGATVNHFYNGPIFNASADGAQLAWNNRTVSQTQNHIEQIQPGYEPLAQAVVRTLEQLPNAGLSDEEHHAAQEAGEEVLAEVVKPDPDHSRIRRGLRMLKGVLAALAIGTAAGAQSGMQDFAKMAIEQLNPWT